MPRAIPDLVKLVEVEARDRARVALMAWVENPGPETRRQFVQAVETSERARKVSRRLQSSESP